MVFIFRALYLYIHSSPIRCLEKAFTALSSISLSSQGHFFFVLRRTALHTTAAEQISASPQWVTTELPVTAAGPSLLTLAILVTGRNPRDYRTNAQLLSGVMGSAHTATSRAELLLWSELSKVQQEGGSLSLPGHAPNDRVILCLPKMPFCLQTHSICHTT